MKRVSTIAALLLFTVVSLSAQTAASQSNVTGRWKFEAPSAPYGYSNGIIEFSLEDNKYASSIIFTTYDYRIAGTNTKFEKGVVSFSVYVEGEDVTITLIPEGNSKMVGKAVYYNDEIPVTLTRDVTKK